MNESFEILIRDGKINEILLGHKLEKFKNPSMASRLMDLVNQYRVISNKSLEDIDCTGLVRAAALESKIEELMGDAEEGAQASVS